MFTGIVKGLGAVVAIDRREGFLDIVVDLGNALSIPEIGASIAVDGVCLTVTEIDGTKSKFSVMEETLEKTTIGDLAVGDHVGLEQPLKMGDELGGHMVLGHVDGVGTIVKKDLDGENCWVTIAAPEFFVKYIVQKGSIAIEGISLTVCDPAPKDEGVEFSVSLLPLTLSLTTLGFKNIGDRVNLEADYVLKAMVR